MIRQDGNIHYLKETSTITNYPANSNRRVFGVHNDAE